jgi:hypothetical protein
MLASAAQNAIGEPTQRVTPLAKRSKALRITECETAGAAVVGGIEPSGAVAGGREARAFIWHPQCEQA